MGIAQAKMVEKTKSARHEFTFSIFWYQFNKDSIIKAIIIFFLWTEI